MVELVLRSTSQPWLNELHFPFDQSLKDWIKAIPGSAWQQHNKSWLLPVEMLPVLRQQFQSFKIVDERTEPPHRIHEPSIPSLRSYQKDAANDATAQQNYLLNFTMGLGKSAAAIDVLGRLQARRTIIVSPAVVRNVWWDREDPDCQLNRWVRTGVTIPTFAYEGAVSNRKFINWLVTEAQPDKWQIVTSYGLTKALLAFLSAANSIEGWMPPDSFVFDEIHYLSHPTSGFSKNIRALVTLNRHAYRLGLTGTAITNDIPSLWNILDTLWPDRFGTYHAFCHRYAVATHNGFGWTYKGLSEEHGAELRARLSYCSSRVVESDLPPGTLPDLEVMALACNDADPAISVAEWIKDMQTGHERFALMTHLRATAEAWAAKLGVDYITGEQTPDERHTILKTNRELGCPLVATLHSLSTGVDLTHWNRVLFVEPTEQPAELIQALKRFHRLNSNARVLIWLLSAKGTPTIARLTQKLGAINSQINPGSSELGLQNIITNILHKPLDPSVFDALLSKALASFDPNGSVDLADPEEPE